MKSNTFLLAALALLIRAAPAQAQPTPVTPPTTASAEVMQCAQAQMVVDRLLAVANGKLETARQSNSATEMRAAVDELQATLRDVRAQLAPCAKVQPAPDPHSGHTMSGAAAPTAPMAPEMKPGATVPPAAPKPAAADPHAGHVSAPAAPTTTKPAAAPTTKPSPTPADLHAGHTMPPAKPAPAAKKATPPVPKPAPTTKPSASDDPHAGHAPGKEAPATTAKKQAEATDPVCGLKVDPKTAPNAQHQGRTYYFCSDQHRQLFSKNPAKYLPGQR